MGEPDSKLPEDLESCHAMIRQLRGELAETQRKLLVYVENERREYEARYGKGVTPQSLLSFGQSFAEAISKVDREAVEAELAAEDAMRPRRRRKK